MGGSTPQSRVFTGLALAGMGGLLMLASAGYSWAIDLARGAWPLFILAVGFSTVMIVTDRDDVVGKLSIVAGLVILLAARFGVIPEDTVWALGPWAFVVVGLAIALSGVWLPGRRNDQDKQRPSTHLSWRELVELWASRGKAPLAGGTARRGDIHDSRVAAPREAPTCSVWTVRRSHRAGRLLRCESEDRMLNERFELRPDAVVVGPDGALGWIDALLAIPGTGQISGFVLREGLLFDRGVRVPIEAVERTQDRRVHVRLSAAQLNDLADRQARGDTGSTAPNGHRVEAGRRVVCGDDEAGSLALVMIDPSSNRATHLVIRRCDLFDREVIVPTAFVRELTADPMVLDLTRKQLESLPEYRADDQITDAVSSLLWYRLAMQPADLRYVKVQTHDGIVHLSGTTGTEQTRLAIEEQVRGVRGVRGVRNDLRTFEALAAAAQMLMQPAGATVHDPLGSEPRAPLDLDGHRPGHDGHAGTDSAAFELDADVATPLKHVA